MPKIKMTPFSFDDVIALALVVGSLVLIGLGRDGEVKAILGMAAGYLFGKRVQNPLA